MSTHTKRTLFILVLWLSACQDARINEKSAGDSSEDSTDVSDMVDASDMITGADGSSDSGDMGSEEQTISVLGLSQGQIVSGTVEVQAKLSGFQGVERVAFEIDGRAAWHDLQAPYFLGGDHMGQAHGYDLNSYAGGSHTLRVRVVHSQGESERTLDFQVGGEGARVPTINTWSNGQSADSMPQDSIGEGYKHVEHAHHEDTLGESLGQLVTHTAVTDGPWSSTTTWGTDVPGEGDVVLVPAGRTVEYDLLSDAALQGVVVKGTLRWARDVETKMVVDTLYGAHGSTLIIGERHLPIPHSGKQGTPQAEVVFEGKEPGASMSLGLVSMGTVRIHGEVKKTRLVAASDPMKGDSSVSLHGSLSGWHVGDKILFVAMHNAGTTKQDPQYDGPTGYYFDGPSCTMPLTPSSWCRPGFRKSQDEVRVITAIDGDRVEFDRPLEHDHDGWRGTLPRTGEAISIEPIVANLSRSIRFRSQHPWGVGSNNVQGRGHIMFMHTDQVDVRYAEAKDMGRTKADATLKTANSGRVKTPDQSGPISDDDNVPGRYPWHIHRSGPFFNRGQVVFKGLSAWADQEDWPQPGWGMVHHGSRAAFEDCVIYNVRGAGMVSETGDEIGQWIDNVVAYVRGANTPANWARRAEVIHNHNGQHGVAYENQARQVLQQGNWASSSTVGWMYLQNTYDAYSRIPHHRTLRLFDPITGGRTHQTGDRDQFSGDDDLLGVEQAQIPDWNNNVCSNCGTGLFVAHRQFTVRHDMTPLRSKGFRTIGTETAIDLNNYTWHYYFFDFAFVRGTRNATRFGTKSANLNLSNGVITGHNGINFTSESNFNGHITTVDWDGEGRGMSVYAHSFSWDPQNHSKYPHEFNELYPPEMGPWDVTNDDDGWKVRFRTYNNRSKDELTVRDPVFELDPDNKYDMVLKASETSAGIRGGWWGALSFQGRVTDSLGTIHFPHWLFLNTAQGESEYTVRRSTTDPKFIVERNGVWTPDGGQTWNMTLYFPTVDRVTGKYLIIEQVAKVEGFEPAFLAAHQLPGNAPTPPKLPLTPEAVD